MVGFSTVACSLPNKSQSTEQSKIFDRPINAVDEGRTLPLSMRLRFPVDIPAVFFISAPVRFKAFLLSFILSPI